MGGSPRFMVLRHLTFNGTEPKQLFIYSKTRDLRPIKAAANRKVALTKFILPEWVWVVVSLSREFG